ncbi:hypothetical protein MLD38_003726 [Melastoma candidum]|uniref:Uncharacterized protein n=1 Tax=Melastoma candidum TaxID=119954 RepID=A0ACB9S6N4_9MYRT|nr:hypothetical protein MLD38_003726 [Melastoma candidum]
MAQGNPNYCLRKRSSSTWMHRASLTLWRLKLFVKEALEVQGKASLSIGDNIPTNNSSNNHHRSNKRKREIGDAIIAKTAKKRNKKLP